MQWCGRLERLGYGVKVAGSGEFEPRLAHPTTGKTLSTQHKMGTSFEERKNKTAKGEGWATPFTCCAQDVLGL